MATAFHISTLDTVCPASASGNNGGPKVEDVTPKPPLGKGIADRQAARSVHPGRAVILMDQ
jgi:hypothetical protein